MSPSSIVQEAKRAEWKEAESDAASPYLRQPLLRLEPQQPAQLHRLAAYHHQQSGLQASDGTNIFLRDESKSLNSFFAFIK